MSKIFIDEVRSIVISNLSDETFGVRELASSLNLSSSQTLRKVKAATGKSVSQYIRELRLDKAAKLLNNTDFSAAEIAYKVGFNSASYFNKTFSKYFGVTPGEYKTHIISSIELVDQKSETRFPSITKTKKLIYVIVLLVFTVIGYFIINNFTLNRKQLPNSIAVLPFKDFSPVDNQWFSDGISDNILNSLSQIKDLSVISYTSSSTYRDSNKQIPEIAKELRVSYVLEGSVTRLEDKIKIIIQLIDANDQHIWSKEYNESVEDLIGIQNDVAQEVLNQLEITLSPREQVVLTKYPTENMEAYSLFLKGRLVDNSRERDDLLNNIKLNKQAVALDPNFAEAYAEIAHSYWQLSRYYGFRGFNAIEGVALAHKYADSALSVNPNTYRALGVKAALFEYIDWDKTNAYYKKALALNPNDALTHIQYALYFQLRPHPNIKKFLQHLTISQQLDPISRIQATMYLNALIFNEKFKDAEDYLEQNKFQFRDDQIRSFEYRILADKNKDWTKIIPYLESKLEKYPDSSLYYAELAYASNAILNDNSAAAAFMEKAYKIDSLNIRNVVPYLNMLIEAKKYKEAQKLMTSENYKSVINKNFSLNFLWYYYYSKGESKNALEVAKNPQFTNDYLVQVLTQAQLGNRKKVDSINKKHPNGTGILLMWRANRAILHAVLEDRDSMYYYLENTKFDYNYALYANARSEFDPYRKEARFKTFLRTNYLPVLTE